jgi:hypothetical protein
MLTLTFLKEQEFIGWAHSITTGSFKSVGTIVEAPLPQEKLMQSIPSSSAPSIVPRPIYRTSCRAHISEWSYRRLVCGLWRRLFWCACFIVLRWRFHRGQVVTGLADGVVIPSFTMPTNGSFTLATPASKVTVGLGLYMQAPNLAIRPWRSHYPRQGKEDQRCGCACG